ncbi:MAG: molybdopterin-binding protein [Gammaproteobacteria bacterium]|jgi:molybdopterin-binding protein
MSQLYRLRNIEYAYGDEVVLRIDEYSIEQNAINALVGSNGSGKSTLLNLLAFITLPSRGELSYSNELVIEGNTQALRRHTAYVQQKPYLFNFTVLQNIELGLKLRGMGKQSRRERAEAQALKLNLQDLLSKRAHELSGGEVQKVAIARALVLNPPVLILDEPFSHLDRQSRIDIEFLLHGLGESGSQTVIFSTHDQIQAHKLAEYVCSLEKGKIRQRLQMNTFNGRVDANRGVFDTGKLQIQLASTIKTGTQIAIDSSHLVLSKDVLKSSMRNHFQGRITSMQEANGEIHVIVDAMESWHVSITQSALNELNINIGETVWLSFKSTAVQVF